VRGASGGVTHRRPLYGVGVLTSFQTTAGAVMGHVMSMPRRTLLGDPKNSTGPSQAGPEGRAPGCNSHLDL
jgi:hypothetical protein